MKRNRRSGKPYNTRNDSPLAVARRRAGLTQEELARRVVRNVATVSKWEDGKRTPPVKYIERVAAALDMSPEQLIESRA